MDIYWKIAQYIYIYTAIRGEDESIIHKALYNIVML